MKNALDVALHFLKFRPRSVFEIEQRLKRAKFSQEETERTVETLLKNRLLDDFEFAKMYVRDRNLLKPSGSFLLRMELKKLGLSSENIESALENQDEEELAKKALQSRSKYRDGEFEKQAQFLQRRGFKPSIIYKILREE